ncbi:collagen type IV alpha-3-binding protein isoform X2 [Lingula anatina]|uniref:Ceramide transfer protein n=1 Tax=Lingula anatina TaxID=7574 RepID=A0A1S3I944_LINAN|nr:collagen type IV alpha-3-binding protein isoform X2 [Lingula anatina]|eukprot:XP_013394772.1 collagen type IV alpha-3-binding protein isoform X2 [Lingula anatina]
MMSEEKDALSLTDEEEDDEFEDDITFPYELQQTLSKWTNYIHGWQDRYFVLKDATLSYYKSENETAFGCRGAVSLLRASIRPHPYDECRFDVSVNDCLWYLRAENAEARQKWVEALETHRQTESGYGSENSLRRHGSMLSITSGTSLSTQSTSSFKRGRGLREKLAEMETFRDILCRQVDTLQGYFDACAEAMKAAGLHHVDSDDIDDVDDYDTPRVSSPSSKDAPNSLFSEKLSKGEDFVGIFSQHGAHAIDFKGEAFTFKATTAGIVATLNHCIELMSQREDAWRKRSERETEKRKKIEEAYKALLQDSKKPPIVIGGPDYEEGPHCAINEDEFFDAVDASLDKLDKEVENKLSIQKIKPPKAPKTSLSPKHKYYKEINEVIAEHIKYAAKLDIDNTWELIHDEGEMKVFKREMEEDGMVVDPLKAVHTVKGITGHEVCHYFWNPDVRMEWEGTLESAQVLDWFSEDTCVCYQIHKKVWPTTQREALFWTQIRHVPNEDEDEDGPDYWIVCNYSIPDHDKCPEKTKNIRAIMNVAMICETVVEPPQSDRNITRENITCKIQYHANVNPGGWAPASVLRAVYKREYPKFLKRFTQYVMDQTKDKPIMF